MGPQTNGSSDVKFHEKQNDIPPEGCRPYKKPGKNNAETVNHQKVENNDVEKVDP